MALIGQIAISMVTNTQGFTKGINTTRRDLNAFASDVTRVGIGLFALGAAGALAISKTVIAASNLEEQADRTRDQFGKFAGSVIDQSELLSTAFGLAKKDILESASVLSAIFESAGYAGKGVADLSVHFVKLATDLSRFANIPFKEALRKIESGLVGQVRPLREVGVALSEAATDAYAFTHGIAKAGAELTDSQKVQARAGFIAEALQKSWGNLAKTGDKVAGAIEAVKGRFENLSAEIGNSLLLIAAPTLGEVQIAVQALQTSWISAGQSAIASSGATIEGLTTEHHTIGILQQSIMTIADGWQIVGQSFKTVQVIITSGIKAIVDGLKTLNDFYIALANLIPGNKVQSNGVMEALQDAFNTTVAQQFEDLKKAQAAPWASEVIAKNFDQARKDIQEARTKLAAMGKLDVLSIKPGVDANAIAGKAHQGFAHAAEFGSVEAVNTILSSTYGSPKMGGAAEKTAQNTAKTNVLLEQILKRGGGAPAVNAAAALLDAF